MPFPKTCPRCGKSFSKRKNSKYCSPECAGVSPKTELDYHLLAFKNAYSWIGQLPKETHDNTTWQCSKNHVWDSSYNSVKQGNGCIYCSGYAKKTAKDYEQLAYDRNFTWLGTLPGKSGRVTQWQCNTCRHEWKASYNNMVSKKSGCPKCAGQARITLGEYQLLAKEKGLTLISPIAITANENSEWQCVKGHTFLRSYSNLKHRDSGCPWCGDFVNGKLVSNPQRELHKMIGGILNYRIGNYAIDIAYLEEKIAVEYDCWYWHDEEKDAKKDRLLFKKGWKIIRIKAGVMLPTFDEFSNALTVVRNGKRSATITLSDYKVQQLARK